MLINCGIKEIIVKEGYPDFMAEGMIKEAGICYTVCKKCSNF
jgi:deoxycytidylate deaminase